MNDLCRGPNLLHNRAPVRTTGPGVSARGTPDVLAGWQPPSEPLGIAAPPAGAAGCRCRGSSCASDSRSWRSTEVSNHACATSTSDTRHSAGPGFHGMRPVNTSSSTGNAWNPRTFDSQTPGWPAHLLENLFDDLLHYRTHGGWIPSWRCHCAAMRSAGAASSAPQSDCCCSPAAAALPLAGVRTRAAFAVPPVSDAFSSAVGCLGVKTQATLTHTVASTAVTRTHAHRVEARTR